MAGVTGGTVGTQMRVEKIGRQAWECHNPEKAAELCCATPFGHYRAQGNEELMKG